MSKREFTNREGTNLDHGQAHERFLIKCCKNCKFWHEKEEIKSSHFFIVRTFNSGCKNTSNEKNTADNGENCRLYEQQT